MTTDISRVDAEQARQALVALRAEVGKAVVGHDAAVTGLIAPARMKGVTMQAWLCRA